MSASIINITTSPTQRTLGAREAEADTAFARTKLKLTRRGRVVFSSLGVLTLIAGLSLAVLFGSTQAAASSEQGAAQFGYVVVQPGSSLWHIAGQLDESADPRDLVSELVRLNQLESSAVDAGQAIAVPLRYAEATGVLPADQVS